METVEYAASNLTREQKSKILTALEKDRILLVEGNQ